MPKSRLPSANLVEQVPKIRYDDGTMLYPRAFTLGIVLFASVALAAPPAPTGITPAATAPQTQANQAVPAVQPAQPKAKNTAAPGVIEMWIRTPGDYTQPGAPAATNPKRVELASLGLTDIEHMDVQYEGSFRFRGVSLRKLFDAYAPPNTVDTALLRFKNGMIIAMPLRDDNAWSKLDPIIAVAIHADENKPPTALPNISRRVEDYVDVRGISFSGNKIVVKDRWHSQVPLAMSDVFSPWTQADSLVAVEFVHNVAYLRQFNPDPNQYQGHELFSQTCVFCHGARKVGASFGWDFVQPYEMYKYKESGRRLFHHMKYRSTSELNRGSLMPALKFVTEEQAEKLWLWLRAIGTQPQPRYTPTLP